MAPQLLFIFSCCYLIGCLDVAAGKLLGAVPLSSESFLAPAQPDLQVYSHLVGGEEKRTDFSYEHSLNFVLVVPRYKLLFCYIPKNACSDFNSLFNELNGIKSNDSPWFGSSAIRQFGWTGDQLVSALRSEKWYKATFLREPLERVLSAYLSKCLPKDDGSLEDDGQHCLGYEEAVKDGATPSYEDFLATLKVLQEQDRGILDAHFRQQSDFCGGLNASDYDFVGSFGQALNPQVKELLEAVGASSAESLADKYFHKNHETADDNKLTKASTSAVFGTYYKNVNVYLHSSDIYDRDYRSFSVLRQRHKANNICATCLYALDFEKKRTLDWIAYHNLMGVNCFLLFIDRKRSNMDDPDVRQVHQHLLESPMVTLLDTSSEDERIPPHPVMKKLTKLLGIRHLITIDGDEFVVLEDSGVTTEAEAQEPGMLLQRHLMKSDFEAEFSKTFASDPAAGESPTSSSSVVSPPSLRLFLDAHVSSTGALGVYMHRWDYGTSGYVQAPSVIAGPEFAMFVERMGNPKRDNFANRHGKVILNLASGTQFVGEHTWTVPESGVGRMLLPNGTVFACRPECVGGPGSDGQNDLDCDHLCRPSSPQKLFINHYSTCSLDECFDRSRRSVFTKGSYYDCNKMHPGTVEYQATSVSNGFTRDDVLAKYAVAVRLRRVELFLARR